MHPTLSLRFFRQRPAAWIWRTRSRSMRVPESKNSGSSILNLAPSWSINSTSGGVEKIRQINEEATLSTDLLPGFKLAIATIFER